MDNTFTVKKRLSVFVGMATIGLSASALAAGPDHAEISAGPEGEVIWDMKFRAIDTNDNQSVEWSELERHYGDRLMELGWNQEQVFDKFDNTDDEALNEKEYAAFMSVAKQQLVQDSSSQRQQMDQEAKAKDSKQKMQQETAANVQQPKAEKANAKQDPRKFAIEQSSEAAAGGLSADNLMGMTVVGKKGEEIGSVENLLVNDQGQIVAVIAQVGGFLDIGDTHVAVPWSEVQLQNGELIAPITEKNVSEYSIFKEEYFTKQDVGELKTAEDDLNTGPNIWKVSELIDDYVVLEDEIGYGYISDVTFDKSGVLQSVVVSASNPDYGYGYYAYPWYGFGYNYGWDAGLGYYTLPYNDRDLVGL